MSLRPELGRVRCVAIDLLRIEHLFGFREGEVDRKRANGDSAVEAGAVADMATRAAVDLDPQPDCILVVVDPDLDDLLDQPARGAPVPEALLAAAPDEAGQLAGRGTPR